MKNKSAITLFLAFVTTLLVGCTMQSRQGGGETDSLSAGKDTLAATLRHEHQVADEITSMLQRWTYHQSLLLRGNHPEEFFTDSLLALFERTEAAAHDAGDEMFMDFDPWSQGQDPDPKTKSSVSDVYDITDLSATADLEMIQWSTTITKTVHLLYTKEGWRIDDFSMSEDEPSFRQWLNNYKP